MISQVEDIDEPLPFYGSLYVELSPLHLSARYGLDPLLDLVLRRTPDLLARCCFNDESVLHLVCECENSLENTRKLLDQGADIEARDASGKTPLMKAVFCDRLDLVSLFIEHGAELETRDVSGQTAIMKSILNRNFDIFELLLKRGALMNVVDNKMNSALHLMFSEDSNFDKKLCEAVLKLGLDLNARNVHNHTPLHVLANNRFQKGKVKYAAMLVKYGADLNELTNKGDSVLHLCARRAQTDVNSDLLIYLINQGANVNIINNRNENFLNVRCLHYGYICGPVILKKLVIEEKIGKFKFNNKLQQMIESDWISSYYQSSYRAEVALLNHLKINESSYLSFFDVFLFDIKKLARICRNELIVAALKKFPKIDFPVYGYDLQRRFQNALILMKAETSISNFLNRSAAMNSQEISGVLDALSISNARRLQRNLPV